MSEFKKDSIIFTTPIIGFPALGGPQLRIQNTIKALAHHVDIHLLCRIPPERMGGQDAIVYYLQYCKTVEFVPKRFTFDRFNRFANRVLRKLIYKFLLRQYSYDESLDYSFIIRRCRQIGAKVIWLGYGNISYPLLKFLKKNTDLQVVCDTDSVWSRFILRELELTNDPVRCQIISEKGRKKELEERWGAELADVTTAVSEVDGEYYRGLTVNPNKVKIVSNVIDLNNYTRNGTTELLNRPSLILAGSFWKNSPMEQAANWTIESVLPIVWKSIPGVHFYIVGKGSKESLRQISDYRISILGQVDSVISYLQNVDVALVPLKFESGTRFKILEAGACGIPIVSTTLGAEGIPVVHNKNILIGDTPEDFANGIITLLMDKTKAAMIAENCQRLVAESYGLQRAVRETGEVFDYLDSIN